MSAYFGRRNLIQPYQAALDGHRYALSFTASLAAAGVANLQIKTGSETAVILSWAISTTAQPITAVAIESPTITNGTVAVPTHNLNRQSTATPVTLFYSNPTNISGGTHIWTEVLSAEKGSGGGIGSNNTWVLKKNTSYVWQITNTGNNTTTVAGNLIFNETILP